MLCNFLCHFVTFKHMLQGFDTEMEFFGDAQQHQYFVGAIAVCVNKALAFQDFH